MREIIGYLDQEKDRPSFLGVSHDFYDLKLLFDNTTNDNRALRHAVLTNNEQEVIWLLKWRGVDGKRVDPYARHGSFIKYACKSNLNILRAFIEFGEVSLSYKNFSSAVNAESLEIVHFMLAYGIVPVADDGNCLLSQACSRGNLPMVKALIEDGRMAPSQEIRDGFEYACSGRHDDVVDYLLDNSHFLQSKNIRSGLNLAAFYNNESIVKRLLAHPLCDPTVNNCEIFRYTHYVKIIKHLIDDGRVNLTICDNIIINQAAIYGEWDSLQLMLDYARDLDPSIPNNEIFIAACEHANLDLAKRMLSDERVFKKEKKNNHGFEIAIESGKIAIITLLCQWPNLVTYDNLCRGFLKIVSHSYVEIIRYFMEEKLVDPSFYDNEAIITAVHAGNEEVIKILLADTRVNPGARQSNALIDAIKTRQSLEIIEALLKSPHVDLAAQHNLPIIEAVKSGRAAVVSLLLKYPAVDPSIDHHTPLRIACKRDYTNIIKILLNDRRFDYKDIILLEKMTRNDVLGSDKNTTDSTKRKRA